VEYNYGWWTAGVDNAVTFRLDKLGFSQKVQMLYPYVRCEATRPNATHIRISYQDLLDSTSGVSVSIRYLNNTEVWSAFGTGNQLQFNWYEADNETDYIVYVVIDHGRLGRLNYREVLPNPPSPYPAAPSLEVFGNWPVSASQLLGCLLLLTLAGASSFWSAPIGLALTIILAAFLTYIGWMSIPYSSLTIALSLAIIWAIGRWKP